MPYRDELDPACAGHPVVLLRGGHKVLQSALDGLRLADVPRELGPRQRGRKWSAVNNTA